MNIYQCLFFVQEAVKIYNQTTMQTQLLEFSRQKLLDDDEVSCVYCVYNQTKSNQSEEEAVAAEDVSQSTHGEIIWSML